MGHILLVTGGARSGKSRYAQQRAEACASQRVYLATAPCLDAEMADRIARHQADRAAGGWQTIEETTALATTLAEVDADAVVLVDCLTLWVNNLLYEAEQAGRGLNEDTIAAQAGAVCEAARTRSGVTVFVTNELGMGIVPENMLARRFRDLAGRCNQTVATAAGEVVLLVSGQPLILKGL